jgi:hypothetical protein
VNLAAPSHLLQGLRVNLEKPCSLVAVQKGFEFGDAEETISLGTNGAWGEASRHNDLLFQQNARFIHRLSKTFWVKADALQVLTGSRSVSTRILKKK